MKNLSGKGNLRPVWVSPAPKLEGAALPVDLPVGILVSAISLVAFVSLAEWVRADGQDVRQFDQSVLHTLHGAQTPELNALARLLGVLGSLGVLGLMAAASVAAGLTYRPMRPTIWAPPLAAVGGDAILESLKFAVHRARPALFTPLFAAPGFSFPSGHAFLSVVVYGLLGFFLLRLREIPSVLRGLIGIGTFLLILFIGVSRVYAGVHYATDVLGGWTAGIPWACACAGLTRHFQERQGKRSQAV